MGRAPMARRGWCSDVRCAGSPPRPFGRSNARSRDADAALEHFANIGHLMEPLMATASVTGEILGTPNEAMRAQLGGDQPKLFTPWTAAHE
jgi:hypothetical protein